jgi:hypothetical protein
MSPWLLLLLTLACAALTVDAFRSGGSREDTPAHLWPREWKRGMAHVPLGEQDRIYRSLRYPLAGTSALGWLFLAMTILLAAWTLRSFLR